MTWEENQYLIHYGIKGQKRGIRRYQNEDGTLTSEGKTRYEKDLNRSGTQIRMSSKGVYEYMNSGHQARAHLKDVKKMYKDSAKVSGDKEYKSEIKKVTKGYRKLAKKHAHRKLSDADRVALAKGEQYLDDAAASALNNYMRKNRKNIRFA